MKTTNLIIILSVAFMFSLIAFNNISDYETNFKLVKTVLSMESVTATEVKWRAVTNPALQHMIYVFIIVWEMLTAAACLLSIFYKSKREAVATAGFMMGTILFMIGFVVIAGEWFYMWDSTVAPMHSKAILLSLLMVNFTIFLRTTSPNNQHQRTMASS